MSSPTITILTYTDYTPFSPIQVIFPVFRPFFFPNQKVTNFKWMFPKIVGFPPKSSILIGFPLFSPSILGCFPIFGNNQIDTTHHQRGSLRGRFPPPLWPRCCLKALGIYGVILKQVRHFPSPENRTWGSP